MKVLITGFDPFGGESINPSFEAVKRLPDQIAGAQIIRLQLPTSYYKSRVLIETAIEENHPDVVINVGQAGGRSQITPEQVAINLAGAKIPDNDGVLLQDAPLIEGGETAYFSTLPIRKIVDCLHEKKIPASISYTAGTYVCNAVMYHVLDLVNKKYPGIRAGFIHVPYITEQVINKPAGTSYMPLEMIVKALEVCINASII